MSRKNKDTGFNLKTALKGTKVAEMEQKKYENYIKQKTIEYNNSIVSAIILALKKNMVAGNTYYDKEDKFWSLEAEISLQRNGGRFRHDEDQLFIDTTMIRKKLEKIFLPKGWDKIIIEEDTWHLRYIDDEHRRYILPIEITIRKFSKHKRRID